MVRAERGHPDLRRSCCLPLSREHHSGRDCEGSSRLHDPHRVDLRAHGVLDELDPFEGLPAQAVPADDGRYRDPEDTKDHSQVEHRGPTRPDRWFGDGCHRRPSGGPSISSHSGPYGSCGGCDQGDESLPLPRGTIEQLPDRKALTATNMDCLRRPPGRRRSCPNKKTPAGEFFLLYF